MENFHYIPINEYSIAVLNINKLEVKVLDAYSDKVRGLKSTDMFDYRLLKYKKDTKSILKCYNTVIAIDKKLKLYWLARYKNGKLEIHLVEHNKLSSCLKLRSETRWCACNTNLESLIDIRELFDNPYDISNYECIRAIGFKEGVKLITINEYLSRIKSSESSNSQIDEQPKSLYNTQENSKLTIKNTSIEQSNETGIDTKNDNTIDKKDVLHSENNSNTTIEKNQKINISDELREKEDTLRKLEETLKSREKSIGAKELQLSQREANIETLKIQLAQREKNLEQREKDLEISNNTKQQIRLENKKAQLDKEEAELVQREKELQLRIQKMNDEVNKLKQIQDHNEVERELIRRERAIADKEENLKDALCKIEAIEAYTVSEVILDVKNIFTFEESEIKHRSKEVVFPNYTYELLLKSLSRGDIITLPKSYIQTINCIKLRYLETLHKKGYVELVKIAFSKQSEENLVSILEYIDNEDFVRVYICREYDRNEVTTDDIIIYTSLYASMRKEVLSLNKNEKTVIGANSNE